MRIADGSGARRVVVLGSTGSIGVQALDVVARNRARFDVVGLAAGSSSTALLAEQAVDFDVPVVAVPTDSVAVELAGAIDAERTRRGLVGDGPRILAGPDARIDCALERGGSIEVRISHDLADKLSPRQRVRLLPRNVRVWPE